MASASVEHHHLLLQDHQQQQPAEVAHKVLRRAQVSKMARALQNRLALANVKVQNGWSTLSLETIEPKLEHDLLAMKRKRPNSSSLSDTSSTSTSVDLHFHHHSSPLTASALFSDDVAPPRSGSSSGRSTGKRSRSAAGYPVEVQKKARSFSGQATWKRSHRLPESSPLKRPSLFAADSAALLNEDLSHSEEDDSDLPLHSFNRQIRSSPPRMVPRTPSPRLSRATKPKPSQQSNSNDSAADLLMFLAASPSPAVPGRKTQGSMHPPSTPPPAKTPLPSSMLSTPGGGSAFLGIGAATPGGMGFNFSDYLNVTPSPAQRPWRTPGGQAAKTPVAAREARRRLDFGEGGNSSGKGVTGLGVGMELGGELVGS